MNYLASPKRENTAAGEQREYQSSMKDSRAGDHSPAKSGFNVSFFD